MARLLAIINKFGYLFAVVSVTLATSIFVQGRDVYAKGQWALVYLLIVGFVAGISGVKPALVAAALSFFSWNFFFLPPYNTLIVHDPKDWLSLLVFLAAATAMGMQTGRLRDREAQALARESEMAMLNQFSARLVSDASTADISSLLENEVTRITGAEAAALFVFHQDGTSDDDIIAGSSAKTLPQNVIESAKWAYRQSKAIGLPQMDKRASSHTLGWPISVSHMEAGESSEQQDIYIPLQSTDKQEGVLYVGPRDDHRSYTLNDVRPIVAAANLTAAFLQRKRLQAVAVQADALREADLFRSTLMSSVSHELKTPIASITATISNLVSEDVQWDASNAIQELTSVQDDLSRLTGSINALIDLSRLEADAWSPQMEWYDLADVISTAMSKLPHKQHQRVILQLPDDLPMLRVDCAQMARAIENLLSNALVYSPADQPVHLIVMLYDEHIQIIIEDAGQGIRSDEREKIFTKFYRGSASTRSASGTGLGLAVTREIVQFHNGKIWVEDAIPHGARFVISLPKEEGPRLP